MYKVGLITNTQYENQFSIMKGSVYIGFLLLFPCLSNAASLGSHLEAKNPYLQNYNPQWSEDAPVPALKYLPRVPLGLKMDTSTASTAQSHYKEVVQGDIFYRTENDKLAGFGPVGNIEKIEADYEQLLRAVFSCFHGQKNLIF